MQGLVNLFDDIRSNLFVLFGEKERQFSVGIHFTSESMPHDYGLGFKLNDFVLGQI